MAIDDRCALGATSLRDGDTHVWLCPAAVARDGEREVLSDEERATADRRIFADDRSRYIASHASLRRVLSAYTSRPSSTLRFATRDGGKPYLPDHAMHFNMSHSGGVVAIAVAGEEVGVDVESVERPVDARAIADRFFTPDEFRWLRAQAPSDGQRAFFRLWTLKEAVMKADGRGMAIPLHTVEVDVRTLDMPAAVRCRVDQAAWSAWELAAGDRLCLAVARRTPAHVRLFSSI